MLIYDFTPFKIILNINSGISYVCCCSVLQTVSMFFYLFIQVIFTHIYRDQDKMEHFGTVQDTAPFWSPRPVHLRFWSANIKMDSNSGVVSVLVKFPLLFKLCVVHSSAIWLLRVCLSKGSIIFFFDFLYRNYSVLPNDTEWLCFKVINIYCGPFYSYSSTVRYTVDGKYIE